jgi:PAS domain-containing protein
MKRRRWADIPVAELKAEVYSRNGAFQRMVAFLGMAPLATFLKDSAGRVLYMNGRAELLWHVTLDAVRGQKTADILNLDSADRRVSARQDNKVLADLEAHVYLETVGGGEDRLRRFSVLKFPVKDDEGDVLLVVFVLPYNP